MHTDRRKLNGFRLPLPPGTAQTEVMTSSFAAAQPVIIDDVRPADARLASRARRTPVFTVRVDGRPVTLKLEFMQATGAFKFRGALNAIATAAGAAEVITAFAGLQS
jgi:hypothetical protein